MKPQLKLGLIFLVISAGLWLVEAGFAVVRYQRSRSSTIVDVQKRHLYRVSATPIITLPGAPLYPTLILPGAPLRYEAPAYGRWVCDYALEQHAYVCPEPGVRR